ncbi:nicotinate-nucleotide adenylyltransferase [Alkalibacillus almallahensis]|uniref:nicotinate-nucleotide adenylyltransferase n=1 Tax=Alkalibacillus almallahensis TaxID=1379154 RepID=UPI001421C6BB|nr:nicotinate-nucleotide adenylyltransferase [Alkalibacillus almallahensis]NIK11307.1 nicotinate-nucleotide adenylyltransferase [Alkalibacillus almallahensis]
MRRIGIFGGTFDPPHQGHLEICQSVLEQLMLDEIWLMPTYQPPHKEPANVTFEHRVNMLHALIEDETNFFVTEIESQREGRSYTLETVKELKERYPNTQFYFIIGGDMVDYLPNWYGIDELKTLIQFIGVSRHGSNFDDSSVLRIEMEEVNVSSSDIRNQLHAHNKPDGLTQSVFDYIKEYRLYEY